MHTTTRRHFLKNAAILSPVLTFLPSYLEAGTTNRLRTGFIGSCLDLIDSIHLKNVREAYKPHRDTTVQTTAINSMIGPLARLSTQQDGAVIDFPNFY